VVIWVSLVFVFYNIFYGMKSFEGNLYVNTIII